MSLIKRLILGFSLVTSALGAVVPVITAPAVLPIVASLGPGSDGAVETSISCLKDWCQDGVSMCLYWGGVTSWDVSHGVIPGVTQTVFSEPCTVPAAASPTSSGAAADTADLQDFYRRSLDYVEDLELCDLVGDPTDAECRGLSTVSGDVKRKAMDEFALGRTFTKYCNGKESSCVRVKKHRNHFGKGYQDVFWPDLAFPAASAAHDQKKIPRDNADIDYHGLSLETVKVDDKANATSLSVAANATVTRTTSSVLCNPTYCQEGTLYCHYWAGVTGWDVSLGLVPGMQRTSVGECDTATSSFKNASATSTITKSASDVAEE
ncbi:hypothetical protein ACHAQH_001688 [Verticillium albo-atrum]